MAKIIRRRAAIDTGSPPLRSLEAVVRASGIKKVGVTLRPRPDLKILQIAAFKGQDTAVRGVIETTLGTAPPSMPNGSIWTETVRLFGTGPNVFWVVAKESDATAHPIGADQTGSLERLFATLMETLAGKAALTEQGHGRCCIRLSGDNARAVLAKGSTLDFHRSAFAPGTCAQTSFLGVSVLIDCAPSHAPDYAGGDAGFGFGIFDLYTARSSAQHVFESLAEAGLEFGLRIEERM